MKLLIFLALLVAGSAQAQILDCCQQAVKFKSDLDAMTLKYNRASQLLTETRKAGDAVQHQKDARIDALQKEANTKLTTANDQAKVVKQAFDQTDLKLTLARSELENEMLRGRFLGFGRKRWANQLLKKLK